MLLFMYWKGKPLQWVQFYSETAFLCDFVIKALLTCYSASASGNRRGNTVVQDVRSRRERIGTWNLDPLHAIQCPGEFPVLRSTSSKQSNKPWSLSMFPSISSMQSNPQSQLNVDLTLTRSGLVQSSYVTHAHFISAPTTSSRVKCGIRRVAIRRKHTFTRMNLYNCIPDSGSDTANRSTGIWICSMSMYIIPIHSRCANIELRITPLHYL